MVSVIVPNYNHAKFLRQRLDSVYRQTFTDFEVILLDDCSTDESRTILEEYRNNAKTAHVVLNEQNTRSPFAQWKKGISLARGKYIWIAESDDFCDLNYLEVVVAELEKGNDLVYSRTVRVDEAGVPLTANQYRWYEDISATRWLGNFENDGKTEARDVLFRKCVINNASAVVFRNEKRIQEYLNVVHGMFYSGDWLFWIQYVLESKRIAYTTATSNYFRTHPGVTRLQTPVKRNPEMMKIFNFVATHELSEGKRKELAEYYFKTHFFKGQKREVVRNGVLASRMIFSSRYFFGPWWRYYFG